MSALRWVRVTTSKPCPICHKSDWCRVMTDGSLVGCMRVETGSFRAKEGRDGSRVYLHRLTDGPHSDADIPPRSGPEAVRPTRIPCTQSTRPCLTV